MTLAYKIFGIPETLEELVDKFKKKKKEQVNIVLREYYSGISFAFYGISAESGRTKVELGRAHGYGGIGLDMLKPAARQLALITAINTGKKLSQEGIKTTIIEDSWDTIKKYDLEKAEKELHKQEKFNQIHYDILNRLLQPD